MKWALGIYVVMSGVTLLAYGSDKSQARRKGGRIPELTLHLLALAGGWPGALVGQRWFRHKTRKWGFQFLTWSIVLAHLGVWAAWWDTTRR